MDFLLNVEDKERIVLSINAAPNWQTILTTTIFIVWRGQRVLLMRDEWRDLSAMRQNHKHHCKRPDPDSYPCPWFPDKYQWEAVCSRDIFPKLHGMSEEAEAAAVLVEVKVIWERRDYQRLVTEYLCYRDKIGSRQMQLGLYFRRDVLMCPCRTSE